MSNNGKYKKPRGGKFEFDGGYKQYVSEEVHKKKLLGKLVASGMSREEAKKRLGMI